MRICLIIDTWNPSINGVVRTFQNTKNVLEKMDIPVTVIVIEPSQFRSVHLPFSHDDKLSLNVWKIGKLIRAANPTHIHIATEGTLGLAARVWLNKTQFLPYTTSYHTRFPEYIESQLGYGKDLSYKYLRWFHKDSKKVMVNTVSMQNILTNEGFNNLALWGRGVNEAYKYEIKSYAKGYTTLKRPILLNVGRVSQEKNLETFYRMRTSGTKVQIGDGPLLSKYKRDYPDVVFMGAIQNVNLLSKAYNSADVFIFPSLTDTYGLVNIEALRSGLPVIAFDVPGPKDIITNYINGYLAHPTILYPHMKLEKYVEDALLLNRNDISESVSHLTWEYATQQFLFNLLMR